MDLNDAIEQIQQPRSRYQLERFVLGQHDTVEMQFYQCVIELNDTLRKYRLAEVSKVRMEREIARLEESDDEDADLDLAEKKIEYDFFLGVMRGGERELLCLLDIYKQIPHFSRDEIDKLIFSPNSFNEYPPSFCIPINASAISTGFRLFLWIFSYQL